MQRALTHLLMPRWRLRRAFPPAVCAAITAAIAATEREHGGQIVFAIETCLDLRRLQAGQSARERAIEVFSQLRVWDTAANNGVLIYLLLADHDIEIVADRGLREAIGATQWEAVCRVMEAEFRRGRFEAGAVAGIRAVARLIAGVFPPRPGGPAGPGGELPDAPVMLD
jgi:uncharacterized membrane protein